MAEKEIKSRIVLDGEKEYSSTIKSASRNLKTLKSELQAETKELGNNATAQQKAEVKAKSLKAQIAEQEKVVKACRAALDEVKEKYGDNEDAVAKYEQKLNNARSALADMNNQLQDVSGTLEQNATDLNAVKTAANTGVTATESFANALEKVSSVGDTVSGAIEGVFSSMIDTVSSAVADMWALISETAAKANNWTDTAALWGTDAQTVQMWSRSMQAAGKDLSSLQTVISRLVLGGKGKQITEMLGISDVNYKDQWKYATDAMDLLYEKYKQGEDITPITEAIFGEKKSTTVLDLLNAWEDIREGLGTFNGAETGYGLTSEGLDMFNELSLQMYKIEAKWEALKDRFAEGFGTTTLTLQAHVIGGLDALADFMNAESDEERQAALEKLTAEVEGFAQDVAAAIEAAVATLSQIGSSLKDSDNPYVSGVGSIFQAIADTMEWIIKNQDDVINALKAIFGFWLVTKIASIAGKLSSVVASLTIIKAWTAGKAITTAAETASNATATAGGASALAKVLTSTGAKIATGAGTFLTTLLDPDLNKHTGGWLEFFGTGADAGNSENTMSFQYEKKTGENVQRAEEGIGLEGEWIPGLNGTITGEQKAAAEAWYDFLKGTLNPTDHEPEFAGRLWKEDEEQAAEEDALLARQAREHPADRRERDRGLRARAAHADPDRSHPREPSLPRRQRRAAQRHGRGHGLRGGAARLPV